MAALKKSLLVLAVAILALAGASGTAQAQGFHPSLVMTCNAFVVPAQARAEGLAELMGDIVAQCSIPGIGQVGGPANTAFSPTLVANVSVNLSVPVTNNKGFITGRSDLTDAVLIMNEVNTTPTADATLSGTVPNTQVPQYGSNTSTSVLQWLGVIIPTPGADADGVGDAHTPGTACSGSSGLACDNPRISQLRISNIRGNATNAAGGGFGGNQIQAQIAISSQTAIPIQPTNILTVAVVVPGLIVDYLDQPQVALQCQDLNVTSTGTITLGTQPTPGNFRIRLTEGYSAAFKTLGLPTTFPGQAIVEDGYPTPGSNDAPNGNSAGATQGTRFIIRFFNIPAGVRLASPHIVLGTSVAAHQLKLQKVAGTDSNGAGQLNPGTTPSNEITVTGTPGTAFVVYEVVDDNPFSTEVVSIPITVAYAANPSANGGTGSPSTGKFQAITSFAPLSTVGTANLAAPEPRFISTGPATDVFTVSRCLTNLLFPYVTNLAGFDTGFAISNTSADDKGTLNQAGTCTIFYFGKVGTQAVTQNDTTPSLAAATTMTWSLSTGDPTLNLRGIPGFQGYMFAQCQFQFAHGMAFITNGFGGNTTIAEGYLALVVPWNGLAGSRGPFSGGVSGESLGH